MASTSKGAQANGTMKKIDGQTQKMASMTPLQSKADSPTRQYSEERHSNLSLSEILKDLGVEVPDEDEDDSEKGTNDDSKKVYRPKTVRMSPIKLVDGKAVCPIPQCSLCLDADEGTFHSEDGVVMVSDEKPTKAEIN